MPPDPTEHPLLTRVLPGPPAPVGVAAAVAAERRPPPGRPWITLCMIASLDGTIAVDGNSAGLGNRTDRAVLRALRQLADVVVVGSATVTVDGYGPPSKPGQRVGVVTNSGSVDLTQPLFESGAGFLIAPDSAPIDESRCQVVRAGHQHVDLTAAVAALQRALGDVTMVLAEGGARLNAAWFAADLVDELALTIAPRVAGGDGPRLTGPGAPLALGFELDQLLVDAEHYTFGRWLRHR